VNNNGGPPFRDFRELDRQKMIDAWSATWSWRSSDPEGHRPDVEEEVRPDRQYHVGSVKMPIGGLDLSSGARAGLTAFLAGVARQVAANA